MHHTQLGEMTLTQFLQTLASPEPVPGGGSVAALAGATGAALVCMVANLTAGRQKFAAVDGEMRSILVEAGRLQGEFLALADADSAAYGKVMAAYKLPKGSEAEKAARKEAVQEALKEAASTPAAVARKAERVLELAEAVAARGNPNAASDAGVARAMAWTALRGAMLNVNINLSMLEDESFRVRLGAEAKAWQAKSLEFMRQEAQRS